MYSLPNKEVYSTPGNNWLQEQQILPFSREPCSEVDKGKQVITVDFPLKTVAKSS